MKVKLIGAACLVAAAAAIYFISDHGISEAEYKYFEKSGAAYSRVEKKYAPSPNNESSKPQGIAAYFLYNKTREISTEQLDRYHNKLNEYHDEMKVIEVPGSMAAYHSAKIKFIKEQIEVIADALKLSRNGMLTDDIPGAVELKTQLQASRQREEVEEKKIDGKFRQFLELLSKREFEAQLSKQKANQ